MMGRKVIVVEDDDEVNYKKLSKKVNRFYKKGSVINLHGLSRFDEPQGKWKKVLKRKFY